MGVTQENYLERKPLGHRAYGSIPHLPGSRLGSGERCINDGQTRLLTVKARDRHDLIIVQEKLDGSNVSVARIGDDLLALTRAGYLASTSPYRMHHIFDLWVQGHTKRFLALLQPGERVVGEWMIQAHGTLYTLHHEPFVAFDIMRGQSRLPYLDFQRRAYAVDLTIPNLVSLGPPIEIDEAMVNLAQSGHGADEVEGAVWRMERKGKVDFLAKYVRPDKIDGKYLPDLDGPGVWNRNIKRYLPETALCMIGAME